MRILLIEDDPLLGDGIVAGLALSAWHVDWFRECRLGRAALDTDHFDALVLDLGLPDCDGLDLLRELRERGDHTPVLILTARDTVSERVHGLDAGADDYLPKPFELDELSARLRAIIRRSTGLSSTSLACGDVTLDAAAHQVALHGEPVHLSASQFAVLELLMLNAGRVVSRGRLEAALHGWRGGEGNVLEVHVHHLRRLLGKDLISTVRGKGYRLECDRGDEAG